MRGYQGFLFTCHFLLEISLLPLHILQLALKLGDVFLRGCVLDIELLNLNLILLYDILIRATQSLRLLSLAGLARGCNGTCKHFVSQRLAQFVHVLSCVISKSLSCAL